MKRITLMVAVAVLSLAFAASAFAGGTGAEFGAHHAAMAREMTGFSAAMNPGMHQGFAGWTGH